MTRESTHDLNERIRLAMASDPGAAIAEARTILKRSRDSHERSAVAGILVDAGELAEDKEATKTGMVTIQKLVKAAPSDGGLRYMLGTAYLALARHDKTPRPQWWEATRKLQIDTRRELWLAAESDIDASIRAQAWINLGNILDECGRWVEAYMAYMEALSASPGHPVAAGWAALMLQRRGGQPGGPNWLPTAHHLARIAQSNLKLVAVIAPGAEKYFAKLSTDRADDFVRPENAGLKGFDDFVLRNRLYLSMSLDASHPDCWDSLTTPKLTEAISTPSEPPLLFAMFNTCKADYLLARHLAWDARNADTDDFHHYVDTLDYARYGNKASLSNLAMRSALDVLDRVAVAANQYFGLGQEPKDVYFRSAWREAVAGEPLRSAAQTEIGEKNRGMLALVSLSDDFRNDGWLFGRQHLRNIATHRFLIIHEMLLGNWRDAKEIEHISVEDLEEATMAALRIARSALMYLSDAVVQCESRRTPIGVNPSVMLPRLGT